MGFVLQNPKENAKILKYFI